jgi:hypothetical protein
MPTATVRSPFSRLPRINSSTGILCLGATVLQRRSANATQMRCDAALPELAAPMHWPTMAEARISFDQAFELVLRRDAVLLECDAIMSHRAGMKKVPLLRRSRVG